MRTFTIRIILIATAGILSGCQPRQAAVTFKSYIDNIDKVSLVVNGDTLAVPYDTVNGAVLRTELNAPAYAQLQAGSMKKLIYVEPGCDFTMRYGKPTTGASRFQFEGKGAAENEFLDGHGQSIIPLRQNMTEEEVLGIIRDSIDRRHQALETTPSLSASFKALEQKRLRYQGLSRMFTYQQWTKDIIPFLQEQMTQDSTLLPTTDYRDFLTDALYFVAWFAAPEHDTYHVNKSQMDYIDTHFTQGGVADFLMESVLTNHMLLRGAEEIAPLMAVFDRKVKSASLREEIGREYEEWSRVLRGKAIPDFTFIDTAGNEIALSRFKGKYVYIDCWATWCGPCRAQIPHLKKLEERYAGKDIAFVSISSDSNREKWQRTVCDERLGGAQLIEKCPTNSPFSAYFKISGIPRFIILDKEGRVYDANAPRPSDPAISDLFNQLI